MKQPNFKSGDLVENIKTGKLELIESVQNTGHGLKMIEFITKKQECYKYHFVWSKDPNAYRKISPKSVKFNLSKTNKSK